MGVIEVTVHAQIKSTQMLDSKMIMASSLPQLHEMAMSPLAELNISHKSSLISSLLSHDFASLYDDAAQVTAELLSHDD